MKKDLIGSKQFSSIAGRSCVSSRNYRISYANLKFLSKMTLIVVKLVEDHSKLTKLFSKLKFTLFSLIAMKSL